MYSETANLYSTLTDLKDKTIIRDQNNQQLVITHDLDDAHFLPIALKRVMSVIESKGNYFTTAQPEHRMAGIDLVIKPTQKATDLFAAIKWVICMCHDANRAYLELNPYLSAFYQSVKLLEGAMDMDLHWHFNEHAKDVVKLLNATLTEFRQTTQSPAFKRELKAYLRNIRKNGKSFSNYINQLFACHAKLLLVRIDVGYGNEMKGLVTYQGAKVHRDQLVKYVKQHYADLVGYVWKLEYTPQKGYHYHLLFVFNGNAVRADILIARAIGEQWVNEITQGGGTYFNCNRVKQSYGDKLGIGMIKRHDKQLRANIEYVVNYLVKTDLYVKARVPAGVRTFGKGEIIEKKVRKNKVA